MSPVVLLSPTSGKEATARGDPAVAGWNQDGDSRFRKAEPLRRDASVAGVGSRGTGRLEGRGRLEDERLSSSRFIISLSRL
jgi:hypothetical protein